jgi:hypothetical protein
MEVYEMRKWMFALLTLVLFLSLAVPVWADDGDGQVVLFGESVVVETDEVVDGDLTVVGGNLELRRGGRVRGDVVCVGGNAIVDGQIDGSLVVVGGALDLQSDAVIDGDLFTLGSRVSRAEGATVRGERVEGFRWNLPTGRIWPGLQDRWWTSQPWRWEGNIFANLLGSFVRFVLRTLALVALGVVLMLFLPKQTELVGRTVNKLPLPSAGVGLLTLVVLLIVVPLLVIICIGIPVVVLLGIAFVAAVLLGRVAVGAVVGNRLLAAMKVEPSQPLLDVAAGIVLMELLFAVPCLGGLLGAAVSLAGLGAVVLTRFGTMVYEPASKAPAMPAPPAAPDLPSAPGEETED